MKQLLTIHKTKKTSKYTIRKETYDEKEYMVVPVVMMLEGVHSGSHGPILHTESELSRFTDSWNGIPVTIGHPKNEQGDYISANKPTVQSVGKIFNTKFEDGKLKAEAWISINKITVLSTTALTYINQQKALDISVGVFSDEIEAEEGSEWNGEAYTAVAKNYRPDHLALLPGEQGACSWNDGCGIRNNQNININSEKDMKKELIESLREQGFITIQVNEGFRAIMDKIENKVKENNTEDYYCYVIDADTDSAIYREYDRKASTEKYFKIAYKKSADGSIELTGDPMEVVQTISYTPKITNNNSNINTNLKLNKMNKVLCPCEKVDALIANERTNFTAEDKTWLSEMSEAQIDAMTPKMVRTSAPAPVVNEVEKPITDAAVAAYLLKKELKDIVSLIPTDLQPIVNSGLTLRTEKRTALITAITANSKGTWKKEELEVMSCDMLSKINSTMGLPDYSAGNVVVVNKADEGKEEPLLPAGV